MKKTIFLLLFVLPFLAIGQVDSPVVEDEDMPVFEDNDVYPDEEVPTAKIEIPAYFKKNKAMKYCSDFRHCGFVFNDSILIPLIYSDLDKEYSDFMIARKGKDMGAINKKGEVVLPFSYSILKRSVGNTVLAHDRTFYGLIDYYGREIVPFQYRSGVQYKDSILIFQSEFNEEKTGKQLIIKILSEKSTKKIFEENYQSVERIDFTQTLKAKKNDRFGLIDFENKALLPFEFEQIFSVKYDIVIAQKDKKYGAVNLNNEIILPFIYDQIYEKSGHLIARNSDKKKGLFDQNGKEILPLIYEDISSIPFIDSLWNIKKDKKEGLSDLKGKIVLPPQYGDVYSFEYPIIRWTEDETGFTITKNEKGRGLLHKIKALDSDKLGIYHLGLGEICPPIYDRVEFLNDEGPYTVYKGTESALMDKSGKLLSDFNPSTFIFQTNNPKIYLTMQADGKRRIFRWSDKKFNAESYDQVTYVNSNKQGYFFTKINKKFALHAPNGKPLTDWKYDNFPVNNKRAESKVTLPKGRIIVAVAMNRTDAGYSFFALDNEGREYPFSVE